MDIFAKLCVASLKTTNGEAMPRTQVTEEEIQKAIKLVLEALEGRLMQKGRGTFASTHEIYGVVAEEFDELTDELRKNNELDFAGELIDIAVGCIFGVASIHSQKTDW
jgi:molybdopterin converting factor small subunit